jgi:hypothetical protein
MRRDSVEVNSYIRVRDATPTQSHHRQIFTTKQKERRMADKFVLPNNPLNLKPFSGISR